MATLCGKERPRAIVGGRTRLRRAPAPRKACCVLCGAELRAGHAVGDLVCDCHEHAGYNPRHDPHLDERVLTLLFRAQGEPLNLYRALGCDGTTTNYDAIHDAVRRLNDSCLVCVVGVPHVGYRLARIGRRRAAKMKA